MNKTQYAQFIKLSQADKKAFIAKATKAGMNKDLLKFLKFSQLATSKPVQAKMVRAL